MMTSIDNLIIPPDIRKLHTSMTTTTTATNSSTQNDLLNNSSTSSTRIVDELMEKYNGLSDVEITLLPISKPSYRQTAFRQDHFDRAEALYRKKLANFLKQPMDSAIDYMINNTSFYHDQDSPHHNNHSRHNDQPITLPSLPIPSTLSTTISPSSQLRAPTLELVPPELHLKNPNCPKCSKKFSLLFSDYTCLSCGVSFCYNHSNFKLFNPKTHNYQRACQECFDAVVHSQVDNAALLIDENLLTTTTPTTTTTVDLMTPQQSINGSGYCVIPCPTQQSPYTTSSLTSTEFVLVEKTKQKPKYTFQTSQKQHRLKYFYNPPLRQTPQIAPHITSKSTKIIHVDDFDEKQTVLPTPRANLFDFFAEEGNLPLSSPISTNLLLMPKVLSYKQKLTSTSHYQQQQQQLQEQHKQCRHVKLTPLHHYKQQHPTTGPHQQHRIDLSLFSPQCHKQHNEAPVTSLYMSPAPKSTTTASTITITNHSVDDSPPLFSPLSLIIEASRESSSYGHSSQHSRHSPTESHNLPSSSLTQSSQYSHKLEQHSQNIHTHFISPFLSEHKNRSSLFFSSHDGNQQQVDHEQKD